jgi:hypothetical protein
MNESRSKFEFEIREGPGLKDVVSKYYKNRVITSF